jgi:hypothetical protein
MIDRIVAEKGKKRRLGGQFKRKGSGMIDRNCSGFVVSVLYPLFHHSIIPSFQ